jgi:hypothetical protein
MAWSAADDMLASWELEEDLEKLWLELGVSGFVILVDVVYAGSDQSRRVHDRSRGHVLVFPLAVWRMLFSPSCIG